MNDDKLLLKELEVEKLKHQEMLSAINLRIGDLRKKIFLNDHGLSIGDTVSFIDGKIEKRGVLQDINVRYSFPNPIVKLFKKDGSLGQREQSVFNENSLKLISPK